ncbi:uncharacterized protein [Chelonus insularis]|uniref:uncharacterized protein isoform X2 n=1 Tax=Chelonus insularis TaxID=460826 RepID=UPI0015899A75|nr:uncharacterized protein LOC118067782 isoform X2 [Chelonus insularis]
MKLSMLIFVLITIIYSCQCAPTPDWVADFQRDMQKMTQDMRQNQQQMDRTFKAIGQQLQNSQKNLEKQLKQISKVAYNGTNGIQEFGLIFFETISRS